MARPKFARDTVDRNSLAGDLALDLGAGEVPILPRFLRSVPGSRPQFRTSETRTLARIANMALLVGEARAATCEVGAAIVSEVAHSTSVSADVAPILPPDAFPMAFPFVLG